ncbi:MAG: 50S ribosomal protein L11 methyltransferase [Geobacter sp.]|nr:50S ribosomal protein L11 methyltransferase [Geobacter sp.]
MSAAWAEVACRVPDALIDQVTDFLVELTGTGVCIDNRILDTFSLDTVTESSVNTVKAYLATGIDLERQLAEITVYLNSLASSQPDFVPSPPAVTIINQEDWANNWKEHFHTSRIGQHLIIKPSWEAFTAEPSDIVIELDPGMAFGTGTHATTRLCLEALERIFNRIPPFDSPLPQAPPAVLDVGTGSGVLSIAARKLGAGRLVAVDIDPEAVGVARENLAQNGVAGDLEISTTPLSQITDTFGIILANILAEDLIRLCPDLCPRLVPGGLLILSGILTEREEAVTAAYADSPLTLVEVTRQDEWSCLVYRREQ